MQEFSTGVVEECRTCSDHVYGNNPPEDCAKDETKTSKCPEYADAACFSSEFETKISFSKLLYTFFRNFMYFCLFFDFSRKINKIPKSLKTHTKQKIHANFSKKLLAFFELCFSSRFIYETNGLAESDTYHGCSTFRITSDSKSCIVVTTETGAVHGDKTEFDKSKVFQCYFLENNFLKFSGVL